MIKSNLLLLLNELQEAMKLEMLWQDMAPDSAAFNSEVPFFVDTMSPEAWLQWVFIPKIKIILENDHALPEKLVLIPYFTHVWPEENFNTIAVLHKIDALFNRES